MNEFNEYAKDFACLCGAIVLVVLFVTLMVMYQ